METWEIVVAIATAALIFVFSVKRTKPRAGMEAFSWIAFWCGVSLAAANAPLYMALAFAVAAAAALAADRTFRFPGRVSRS